MSQAPHRSAFPILAEQTYLASHSLGAVPEATREALAGYHEDWATLGIRAWEGPWWQAMEAFTEAIEAVLGGGQGTVAPMLNATRGMAGVLSALSFDERDKIVLTDQEFTTSYPLFRGLERQGARLEIVESPDGITVPTERVLEAIDDDTALVHTCHVYFRSGAIADLATITDAAHDAGALVLADAYQSAGVVPVDVHTWGIDALVGGSHKWLCGGPGAGYLYVREDVAAELEPTLTGWFGLEDPFAYEPTTGRGQPAAGARRFLAGTVNVPGMVAALAGIELVLDVGAKRIRERSLQLTDAIIDHADDRGLSVRTPREPGQRGGMVCLDIPEGERVTQRLVEEDVIVDWRPDCGIRVSPHYYNTLEEIDRFFEACDEVA